MTRQQLEVRELTPKKFGVLQINSYKYFPLGIIPREKLGTTRSKINFFDFGEIQIYDL